MLIFCDIRVNRASQKQEFRSQWASEPVNQWASETNTYIKQLGSGEIEKLIG